MESHETKIKLLVEQLANHSGKFSIKKKTISNLFRYNDSNTNVSRISLQNFNQILNLDTINLTLDVEGLTTYEAIVDHTLKYGLLPTVNPELKHITVGGATVGIGIESTGFRHGFVHDGLIEAEVLLRDGRVVVCNANNEYADLFHALPNSYGTLGYILRAKIKLHKAKPFVHLKFDHYDNIDSYIDAMEQATHNPDIEFIEGLFYDAKQCYLITGNFVDDAKPTDIVRQHVFYKLISSESEVYLTTKDYIFRYDPEWFWNIPDTKFYNYFRRYAPMSLRNSSFYTRYSNTKSKIIQKFNPKFEDKVEPLIQDWEVTWDKAKELMAFCCENVDLQGKPWVALPIKPLSSPTLYPVKQGELYFNLGCYCQVDKSIQPAPYHYTKIMDDKCFELDGIKMLYSSTFLDKDSFNRIYNGNAYQQLKTKYDPDNRGFWLYDKVCMSE